MSQKSGMLNKELSATYSNIEVNDLVITEDGNAKTSDNNADLKMLSGQGSKLTVSDRSFIGTRDEQAPSTTKSCSDSVSNRSGNATICREKSISNRLQEKFMSHANDIRSDYKQRSAVLKGARSTVEIPIVPVLRAPSVRAQTGPNIKTAVINFDAPLSRKESLYSAHITEAFVEKYQTPPKVEIVSTIHTNTPKTQSRANEFSPRGPPIKYLEPTYNIYTITNQPGVETLQELTRKRTESFNRVLAQPELLKNATPLFMPINRTTISHQCPMHNNTRVSMWDNGKQKEQYNMTQFNDMGVNSSPYKGVKVYRPENPNDVRNVSNHCTMKHDGSRQRDNVCNDYHNEKYGIQNDKETSLKHASSRQRRCCC